MTTKTQLINRLSAANPTWHAWDELLALVRSLDFNLVDDEYMGKFLASGSRLTFRADELSYPAWMPLYVPALRGMKVDEWEMAGGYADSFDGRPASRGRVFSSAGNDEALGFPLIDVPELLYAFQSNTSGATFFINTALDILYPNADKERFEVLDTLEGFTRTNIQQVVQGREWFEAYSDKVGTLLD